MKFLFNITITALMAFVFVTPTFAQDGDQPAITVNGEVLTKTEFNQQVDQNVKQMSKMAKKKGKSPPVNSAMKKRIRNQVIEQSIDKLVLRTKAKEANIDIDDSQVDEVVKKQQSKAGGEEKLNRMLEKQGTSRSDFRDTIREQLTVQSFLEKKMDKVDVSDERARSFYEKQKGKLKVDSFEAAKDRIKAVLKRQEQQKQQQRIIKKLRSESDIEVHVEQE